MDRFDAMMRPLTRCRSLHRIKVTPLVLLVVILKAMAVMILHDQNVNRDFLGLICSETTMSGLEPR